eukprot:1029274-Rhodomonas_salina.1
MDDEEGRDPRQSGKEPSSRRTGGTNARVAESAHRSAPDADAPSNADSIGPECVICQGGGSGAWRALPCAHAFHATCVERWISSRSSCPVCRMEFHFSEDGVTLRSNPSASNSAALVESNGEVAALHQVVPASAYSTRCPGLF